MTKLTTTSRAIFDALKSAKAQARHIEIAHAEALELNAMPVLHNEAPEKAYGVDLTKEQRAAITRAANAGDLNTADDLRKAAYEQATKDVQSGGKTIAEAVSALRELFGSEFSAEYFQNLEFEGVKKIKANSATMKDAGRAIKGNEGRWAYKCKDFTEVAIEWLEQHIELDAFKENALSARSRMNQFTALVNSAATGNHKKTQGLGLMHDAFNAKIQDGATSLRMGWLSAEAGVKDTYPKNLGRVLKAFGAATLSGGDTVINPNYDHPIIKAIAERA